jgi:hypothetical protein
VTPDPTIELWERLARPFDPSGAVGVFTGLRRTASRQLVGAQLATSPEAEHLLDRMHEIVRSLAVATTSSPTRTDGDVRGPILWSETVAARAATFGASNVLVCASTMKAYDTDENQVLVHALATIRDAARDADPTGRSHGDDEVIRRARYNGMRAIRALDHRTLASLQPRRPTARAMQKARTGPRARDYRAAVAVIERAADPVSAEKVAKRCASDRRREHASVLALIDRLGEQTVRVEGSMLRAGPVRYVLEHDTETGIVARIALGDLVLDVHNLKDIDDIDRAVDRYRRPDSTS